PLIGMLVSKTDPRKLLALGLIGSALAMFRLSRLDLEVSSGAFWLPLLLQGASLGLVFVPLTTVTNDPIPRERMGSATSIFNLMRNIGASMGISAVTTMQFRQTQAHINVLGEHVSSTSSTAQRTIAGLEQVFIARGADPVTAAHQAHGAV